MYADDGVIKCDAMCLCVGVPAFLVCQLLLSSGRKNTVSLILGGFHHGIGACMSDCEVRCVGNVIGLIMYYFLIDCKFDLSKLRSCYTYKPIH
jgi:hypothetical protein